MDAVHVAQDEPNVPAGLVVAIVAAIACAAAAVANAAEFDLKGSLGQAGFTHYVSPVSNPLFNETPYITTEIRPMWMHTDRRVTPDVLIHR